MTAGSGECPGTTVAGSVSVQDAASRHHSADPRWRDGGFDFALAARPGLARQVLEPGAIQEGA